ncbi:Ubiquitin carboxyl-terminal hydrolase 5 [Lamellibrachia satsuma]|nr:Ubiquitin carboxyl-terminal hydrolase 5 [Lamellibrachia satsuma]
MEGIERKSYSAAVIEGVRKRARVFVGDSIVRKTDRVLNKGDDVVVCLPGAKIEAITERVKNIVGSDVYSYEEDDMVEDPYLAKHLAHFGIDIMSMQKTEKTMVELEIDLNQKIGEWDIIQEAGSKLQPVYGPGYTGMYNLGNSCYMNSVMQVIFMLPDFQHKYFEQYDSVISRLTDPAGDFTVQMTKLAYGLLSGKYSKEPPVTMDSKEATIIVWLCVTITAHLHMGDRVDFLVVVNGELSPFDISLRQSCHLQSKSVLSAAIEHTVCS